MSPFNLPAFAPGFDPQALPDVAPLVPQARPWQWLTDGGSDPAEVAAYLERFVAGFGTTDPSDRDLTVRPLPRAAVIASHLDQEVLFDAPGSPGAPAIRLRLSAVGPRTAAPEGAPRYGAGKDYIAGPVAAGPDGAGLVFPFSGPVAVVGTFPPSGRALEALGRDLRAELTSRLDLDGIGYWPAAAVDPGRRWLEDVLIVDYSQDDQVRFVAREHLQPFLSVWRGADERSVVEVMDLQQWSDELVVATAPVSLGRVLHRTCPVVPGAGTADLCHMNGGPWVSRSITAAARWETKRSRMIRALGCDTCGDGEVKVMCGGPLRVVTGRRNTRDVRVDSGRQSRHDELVADAIDGE